MSKTDELTNEASAIRKPVSGIAEQGGSGAIAQLIQQYCPNGVEYVPLHTIASQFSGMTGVSNKWAESGNCLFIDYMNVYKNISVDVTALKNATVKNLNQNVLKKGDILFTSASETPDECALSAVIESDIPENIFLDDHLFGLRLFDKSSISPSYLKYAFRSNYFRTQVRKVVRGVTRNYVSKVDFMNLEIPVPPLVVQEEIVKILDRFAVYAAELQAELQARQQQYQFYRDRLLSFEGRDDVQWKKLGEVCEFIKDGTHGSYKNVENGYPLLSAKDINNGIIKIPVDCRKISIEDYNAIYKNYKLLQGDVLITIVGSIGRTAVVRDSLEVAFQRSVGILRPTYKILSSYLSYILRTSSSQKQLTTKTNKSAQGGIYLGELNKIEIPVPPLEEQQRIVDILDRFDTLVNDLSQGLPAEIEARQQQYEYYRDQLLTFKRV